MLSEYEDLFKAIKAAQEKKYASLPGGGVISRIVDRVMVDAIAEYVIHGTGPLAEEHKDANISGQ